VAGINLIWEVHPIGLARTRVSGTTGQISRKIAEFTHR